MSEKRTFISGPAGSSSGGGGAVTVADGADATQGAIADVAVTGDNAGTVSAKLRGFLKILTNVWDSINSRLNVAVLNTPNVAVTNAPTVAQGTAAAVAGAWPVKVTDGVNVQPTGDAAARTIHTTIDNASIAVTGAVTATDNVTQVGGVAIAAAAKGTQGANALPVQDLKDAGRVPVILTIDNIAGITVEALASMTINKGGTVSTATSYTVTAGKTLRITSFALSIVNPSTTNASGRARLRSAAPVAVTSPIFGALACGAPAAVAFAGGTADISYPDGIEFAAAQQVGISHVESSAIASGVSICITGFEY